MRLSDEKTEESQIAANAFINTSRCVDNTCRDDIAVGGEICLPAKCTHDRCRHCPGSKLQGKRHVLERFNATSCAESQRITMQQVFLEDSITIIRQLKKVGAASNIEG